MNIKNRFSRWALFVMLLGALSVLGCAKSNDGSPSGTRGDEAPSDGSSSGGGSFGDESSLTILRWAAEDLSRQISNSSPEIYAALPAGWSQEKLADVIRNVEPVPSTKESYQIPEVSRYGQRLMFDYRKRAGGEPYITATRLFMDAYSHYEVNSRPRHEFRNTIEEVKLKLAHEAAHLMGLGLSRETDMAEARVFSKALLDSIDRDNFECLPVESPPREVYTPLEAGWIGGGSYSSGESDEERLRRETEHLKTKTRAYVFNRPTGRAAVPTNMALPCKGQDGISGLCPSDGKNPDASDYITVFAPRSYDEKFDLASIKKSVLEGKRSYADQPGSFSWELVDLRKATMTDEGYRSNYKYSRENSMNNNFSSYLDFEVKKNSSTHFEMETYPPLWQEHWDFYRSQGKSRISLTFKDGKISSATMVILKNYNLWLEDKAANDLNILVPLTCVRSFKPL